MINYALLIAALIQVESGGNDQAIGDDGHAVGVLQLHEIFVEDVNRIYGSDYKPDARYDRAVSMHMVVIWLQYYAKHYEECTGMKPTYEVMARIYNSGYRGYNLKPHASDHYWSKVKKELKLTKVVP